MSNCTMKYFVYKQNHNDTYWSAQKGWVKYEWATVYSQEEVDKIEQFGGIDVWGCRNCKWVPHEPPKPIPVIIGEDNPVTMSGNYWCYFQPTKTRLGIVEKIAGKHSFLKGYWYVYIPEPNWPA